MADEQRNVKINFDFKRSGDTEALNSFKKLQQSIETNKARADGLKQEFAQMRGELEHLDEGGSQALVENTEKARRAAQQAQTEFAQLRGEIKAAAEQADKLGTNTQKAAAIKAGGSNFSFGTVQRGLSGLGVGGVGEIAGAVDDLTDLTKQVQSLGTAAKEAGGIGPLLTNLTGLGPVGLAAGAGIGVAAAALAVITKTSGDAAEGIKAELLARKQYKEFIALATKEELQAKIEQTKKDVALAQQEVNDLNYVRTKGFEEAQKQFGDLGARAIMAVASAQNKQGINDIEKSYADANAELAANNALLDLYTKGLQNNATATNDEAAAKKAATDKATEATKNFVNELKRYQDIQQQLKDASAAITSAEKDRQAVIQKRAQDDLRAAQVSQLEAQITAAKAKEEDAARLDRIKALRADSTKAEVESAAKTSKAINDVNQRYMEQGLKSLNRYLTAEQRATENYNVNRVRKLEDLYANLSELAAKGDVAAFVTTRRTGLRDIRRGDEDFGSGARQRLEDYQTERRDALQARNQQITELRAAAQTELQGRKAEIAEKIKLEQAAGQQQLSQSQQLQQQLANLRQQFAQQDLDARRRSEDEAYTELLGKLRKRKDDVKKVIDDTFSPAVKSVGDIATSVVDFVNRIRQAANASALTPRVTNSYSAGARGAVLGSYSSGTPRVPLTGVYQLHEGEAVLNKYQAAVYRSSSTPGFAGGSRQLVINVNQPVFGEVVTPSVMHEQIDEVVAGLSLAVSGAG